MLGGVLLGFSGLTLMDCGSSGTNGGPEGGMGTKGTGGTKGAGGTTGTGSGGTTGTGSGGSMGTSSGGAMGSGGTMGSTTDGGDGGGGVDCGKAAALHPETAPGVYCPFSSIDGGPTTICTAGQICCQPSVAPYAPSTCQAESATDGGGCPVAGSIVWECEGPMDCAASSKGKTCCGFGVPTKEAATCSNYNYVSGATGLGTVCATTCAAGQTEICDQAAGQCTAPAVCTATKYHGNQVGYCL